MGIREEIKKLRRKPNEGIECDSYYAALIDVLSILDEHLGECVVAGEIWEKRDDCFGYIMGMVEGICNPGDHIMIYRRRR